MCGLFTNIENPFLYAIPDFPMLWDCCGSGCGEAECPLVSIDGYVQHNNSCLENGNRNLQLKNAIATTIKYRSSFSEFHIFVVYAISEAEKVSFFCAVYMSKCASLERCFA